MFQIILFISAIVLAFIIYIFFTEILAMLFLLDLVRVLAIMVILPCLAWAVVKMIWKD